MQEVLTRTTPSSQPASHSPPLLLLSCCLGHLCCGRHLPLQDLAEKLYCTPSVRDSGRFSKPKLSNTAFTIQHYAGPVTYQTDNFLDKNKDFVVAEHQALLEVSARPFVRELFPPPETVGGQHTMRNACIWLLTAAHDVQGLHGY